MLMILMFFAKKVNFTFKIIEFYQISYQIGVYDIEQSRRILLAGKEIGLGINFHGDELNYTGSAEVRCLCYFILFFFLL